MSAVNESLQMSVDDDLVAALSDEIENLNIKPGLIVEDDVRKRGPTGGIPTMVQTSNLGIRMPKGLTGHDETLWNEYQRRLIGTDHQPLKYLKPGSGQFAGRPIDSHDDCQLYNDEIFMQDSTESAALYSDYLVKVQPSDSAHKIQGLQNVEINSAVAPPAEDKTTTSLSGENMSFESFGQIDFLGDNNIADQLIDSIDIEELKDRQQEYNSDIGAEAVTTTTIYDQQVPSPSNLYNNTYTSPLLENNIYSNSTSNQTHPTTNQHMLTYPLTLSLDKMSFSENEEALNNALYVSDNEVLLADALEVVKKNEEDDKREKQQRLQSPELQLRNAKFIGNTTKSIYAPSVSQMNIDSQLMGQSYVQTALFSNTPESQHQIVPISSVGYQPITFPMTSVTTSFALPQLTSIHNEPHTRNQTFNQCEPATLLINPFATSQTAAALQPQYPQNIVFSAKVSDSTPVFASTQPPFNYQMQQCANQIVPEHVRRLITTNSTPSTHNGMQQTQSTSQFMLGTCTVKEMKPCTSRCQTQMTEIGLASTPIVTSIKMPIGTSLQNSSSLSGLPVTPVLLLQHNPVQPGNILPTDSGLAQKRQYPVYKRIAPKPTIATTTSSASTNNFTVNTPGVQTSSKQSNRRGRQSSQQRAQEVFKQQLNDACGKVAKIQKEQLVMPDHEGDIYLHIAVARKDEALVHALLHRMISEGLQNDIDYANKKGETALYIAACKNMSGVVALLISKGANVNVLVQKSCSSDKRNAPIHVASSMGADYLNTLVELLKAKHINVNIINTHGQTALHCAVLVHRKAKKDVKPELDSREIVKTLIKAGADPCAMEQSHGRTPLMEAIIWKRPDIMETILRAVDKDKVQKVLKAQDFHGKTGMDIAGELKGSSGAELWNRMNNLLQKELNGSE